MKILLSGLIANAKGKCGDIVISHNHYGLFARERINTPATNSHYWTDIRDHILLLNVAWSALPQYNRDCWNSNAKLFARSDSIGQQYHQTGFHMYIGTNINRWFCGEISLSMPPVPTFVPRFENIVLAADSTVPEKILTFTPAINAAYMVKLWVSKALHAGISKAFHQFRMLMLLDDLDLTGIDIESDFVTRFLTSGSAGEKVFIKSIFVHKATGLVGQPTYTDSIII